MCVQQSVVQTFWIYILNCVYEWNTGCAKHSWLDFIMEVIFKEATKTTIFIFLQGFDSFFLSRFVLIYIPIEMPSD